jgi:hypothetical protein
MPQHAAHSGHPVGHEEKKVGFELFVRRSGRRIVPVHLSQARNEESARAVDPLSIGGNGDFVFRSHLGDPIVFNDHRLPREHALGIHGNHCHIHKGYRRGRISGTRECEGGYEQAEDPSFHVGHFSVLTIIVHPFGRVLRALWSVKNNSPIKGSCRNAATRRERLARTGAKRRWPKAIVGSLHSGYDGLKPRRSRRHRGDELWEQRCADSGSYWDGRNR